MGIYVDAKNTNFETVEVLGIPMLFTILRIDRNTIPKGLYAYDVRHCDEDWGSPCEIKEFVLVNHMGTLISKTPIELNDSLFDDGVCDRKFIDEDDFEYVGAEMTLDKYVCVKEGQNG